MDTSRRERALGILCDTFVPGARGTRDGGADLPSASELGVPRRILEDLEALGRPALLAELDQLVSIVESPLANVVLAGRAAPFSALTQPERERYLLRWSVSPIPLQRKAFQVLKRLTMLHALGEDGSPYAKLMGYERPLLDEPAEPAALRARVPGPAEVIEADACVVGSGAGGAVAAAVLASAGRRVVVLERAPLRTEAAFDSREADGLRELYLDRALLTTDDRAITVLAGSAVGGGTVVNWNTCLRLPAAVQEEWRALGLADDLGPHYDAVEARLDVDTDESHRNGANAALERGTTALGWSARTIPRNVRGCGECGHCGLGCRRGAKRSTMRTYLVDACRDGAQILHATEAWRILVEDGAVTGVVARVAGGEVTVRAPLVALAGGAVLSPALLLRSGIAAERAGRGLHLHPVSIVLGMYDEPIRIWEGVPQSVLCDEFAEVDGAYGFRIECPPGQPGLIGAAIDWRGSAEVLETIRDGAHLGPFFALVRDREGGRVTIDRAGLPVLRYEPGPSERRLLVRAMLEMARLHRAAGARRILTLHAPQLVHERGSDFDAFLDAVGRRAIAPNRVGLYSAHQMSTCRIGTSPRTSVADPDGRVWGVRGLFVTDASAFPNASGVNPMLTTMALARRTAQRMLGA